MTQKEIYEEIREKANYLATLIGMPYGDIKWDDFECDFFNRRGYDAESDELADEDFCEYWLEELDEAIEIAKVNPKSFIEGPDEDDDDDDAEDGDKSTPDSHSEPEKGSETPKRLYYVYNPFWGIIIAFKSPKAADKYIEGFPESYRIKRSALKLYLDKIDRKGPFDSIVVTKQQAWEEPLPEGAYGKIEYQGYKHHSVLKVIA